MRFPKTILSLGAVSLIAGCSSTLPVLADGCGSYPEQKSAQADNRPGSDAAPIYYLTDSFDEHSEYLDSIGTPGYHAVNGQLAHIPPQPPKQYPRSAPLKNVPSGTYQYIIQPGDTVYSLARRNCVSMKDIRTVNGINSQSVIRVGDILLLPKDRCKA